jgi:uncharacterized SAM-binding protein YcdF (DUF218 family)
MIPALQRVAVLLLMPAGLFWLLLIGACILAFRRGQKTAARMLLGLVLLYGGAGNIHLGPSLLRRLEAGLPRENPLDLPPFDAVLVLGGGTEEDPSGRPQLGFGGDRLRLAAALWHGGRTRVLVVGGASRDGARGVRDLGRESREVLRQLGVPDAAILELPVPCWNTREEIAAHRAMRDRRGWTRVGLLSSAYHLPRALAQAERTGLVAVPIPADWKGHPHGFSLASLVPQEQGFRAARLAGWEYLGRWAGH